MQFLPRLSAVPDRARPDPRREIPAGRHLPYLRHVDDQILELRDGTLMATLRLAGLAFETTDSDALNYRKDLRDAMLRAVAHPRLALYHHIQRHPVAATTTGLFPDAFSAKLDARWQARLAARQLYGNTLTITVLLRPARAAGLLPRLASCLGAAGRDSATRTAADARLLHATLEQLVAALIAYQPEVLTVTDTPQGPTSPLLAFLAGLYNATHLPIRLPYGDAGHILPARRISFGEDIIELAATGPHPATYAAIVSIKDYPGETTPGMLDALLRLPAELVISQSFAFVTRAAALSAMNLALRRLRAADDEALSLRDDLATAKDEVAAGRAAMGEHHLSILVRAPSQSATDAAASEVLAALSDLGIVAVREDLGLEAAFWAQFPGNFAMIARRALIGTANFASLASAHNFPTGRAQNNPWGPAIATFETTAAGPYHFNFHADGDLGNFVVIGPSGSGKTVIVNFLLAQARRLNPRIVLFDKDRGAELFIRAIGGAYDQLRPGTPSGLNPLRLPDTPANRRFLIDWLAVLAETAGPPLDAAERARIEAAVAANYAAPPAYRRLQTFVELLRGHQRPTPDDLHARLRPWWGDGIHAWLFDNETDQVDLTHPTVGFDMTHLLDDPHLRTPAMMYLFHRVDERLDGTPTIIVVDEGWKALDDAVFAARIRDWLKTLRKRNGLLGFVTQNAGDALASQIAGTITEQTATQIFTPNPQARAEDYIDGFHLTPHEFDLIRTLPDSTRCFLVRHGHDSVVLRLNLAGEHEILTILSGRERNVRRLDEIRARVGDDPADWLPELAETTGAVA